MTKVQLINSVAEAIAAQEGFFVTEEQARQRGLAWPTRAQRNENPGNIRAWKTAAGKPYPQSGGFVDFVGWAEEMGGRPELAQLEGWRVLKVLVAQYVAGRYTKGISPTLKEMFAVYAPAADKNDPEAYARFVAKRTGLPIDKRLLNCVTEVADA